MQREAVDNAGGLNARHGGQALQGRYGETVELGVRRIPGEEDGKAESAGGDKAKLGPVHAQVTAGQKQGGDEQRHRHGNLGTDEKAANAVTRSRGARATLQALRLEARGELKGGNGSAEQAAGSGGQERQTLPCADRGRRR